MNKCKLFCFSILILTITIGNIIATQTKQQNDNSQLLKLVQLDLTEQENFCYLINLGASYNKIHITNLIEQIYKTNHSKWGYYTFNNMRSNYNEFEQLFHDSYKCIVFLKYLPKYQQLIQYGGVDKSENLAAYATVQFIDNKNNSEDSLILIAPQEFFNQVKKHFKISLYTLHNQKINYICFNSNNFNNNSDNYANKTTNKGNNSNDAITFYNKAKLLILNLEKIYSDINIVNRGMSNDDEFTFLKLLVDHADSVVENQKELNNINCNSEIIMNIKIYTYMDMCPGCFTAWNIFYPILRKLYSKLLNITEKQLILNIHVYSIKEYTTNFNFLKPEFRGDIKKEYTQNEIHTKQLKKTNNKTLISTNVENSYNNASNLSHITGFNTEIGLLHKRRKCITRQNNYFNIQQHVDVDAISFLNDNIKEVQQTLNAIIARIKDTNKITIDKISNAYKDAKSKLHTNKSSTEEDNKINNGMEQDIEFASLFD